MFLTSMSGKAARQICQVKSIRVNNKIGFTSNNLFLGGFWLVSFENEISKSSGKS